MQLSNVRPVMMLQLARLPGHNYATSCAGFIDSEFASYVSKYSNAGPSNAYVAFPNPTVANPSVYETDYQIENPYQIRNRTWNGEEWQRERKDRIQELKDLQAANGAGNEKIVKTEYPTTFADLSFTERMDALQSGYEPFKDASAYRGMTIESEDEYWQKYCTRNPKSARCQQNTITQNSGGNSIIRLFLRG
jgi:hypothetical protein